MSEDTNKSNKKVQLKQKVLMFAFFIVITGVASIAVLLTDSTKPKPPVTTGQISLPGEFTDARELWRASAEQEIEELTVQNHDLKGNFEKLQSGFDNLLSEFELATDDIRDVKADIIESRLEQELLKYEANATNQRALTEATIVQDGYVVNELAYNQTSSIQLVRVGYQEPSALEQTSELGNQVFSSVSEVVTNNANILSNPQLNKPETQKIDHKNYLPSGTFMSAVILGGIDAPTATTARDNPHPVLLRVSDVAKLPNLAQKDLRECLILAAGYGDLSSERALIRTERMSCKRRDGTFFDSSVKGFIVGEDGRAGVRGRLVSKRKDLIVNSFLAGLGSGFGSLIEDNFQARRQQSRQNYITAVSGNDRTIVTEPERFNYSDFLQAGIGSGLSSSLSRVSDYYLALAERLHPIIEIGAGREVEIVLQVGIDLSVEPKVMNQ